jgi:hypothetical protein
LHIGIFPQLGWAGSHVSVPINLTDGTDNLSSQNPCAAAEIVVRYDASVLTANSASLGSLLTQAGQSWSSPIANIDNVNGAIVIGTFAASGGLSGDFSGELLSIDFTINAGASGATPINLASDVSNHFTEIDLADSTPLTLNPAPTNGASDAVDGSLTVNTPPSFTSANATTFTVGAAVTISLISLFRSSDQVFRRSE